MEYEYPLISRFSSARERNPGLASHAAMGAIIAVFLASIWVVNYLVTSNLWDDVLLSPGMINTPAGGKAMFIVISRFLVGFGVAWTVITLGLSLKGWWKEHFTESLDIDEDEDPRF